MVGIAVWVCIQVSGFRLRGQRSEVMAQNIISVDHVRGQACTSHQADIISGLTMENSARILPFFEHRFPTAHVA